MVERLIVNLTVLGRVGEGERVCSREGLFVVCGAGPVTALRRLLRSETRESSLHALEALVESAVSNCTKLCEQVRSDMEEEEVITIATFIARAQRDSLVRQLLESMQLAQAGLERLAVTYAGDCATVARLEVLCKRLCSVTNTLSEQFPYKERIVK
jgi:hypothetical protein